MGWPQPVDRSSVDLIFLSILGLDRLLRILMKYLSGWAFPRKRQ